MSKDLLHSNINESLKSLAGPAAVGFIFHTLYNVTDTYFAGMISTEALAALSLSFPVFFLLLSISIGMSEALTAIVSNQLGKGDTTRASIISKNAIFYALLLSALTTLYALGTNEFAMRFLGAEGAYLQASLHYIDTVSYGALFFVMSMFFNALLNAQGDMTSMRNILIVTSILNVIFDYVFVQLGFGVQGIAFATISTEAIAMMYLLYKLSQTELLKATFMFDFSIYKQLFSQGIAPTTNMLFMSLGIFVITYYASVFGSEVVAAMGIGMRIEQLALMPVVGISVAVLTMVAQNNGAKKYDRIQETLKHSMLYSLYIAIIAFAILMFFPEMLMAFFTDDAKVIAEGITFLHVEAFLVLPFAAIFIYISLLQGIEKPKFIFYISLARQILFPIILLEVLSYFTHNVLFVWIGIAASVVLSSVIIYKYATHQLNATMYVNK